MTKGYIAVFIKNHFVKKKPFFVNNMDIKRKTSALFYGTKGDFNFLLGVHLSFLIFRNKQ